MPCFKISYHKLRSKHFHSTLDNTLYDIIFQFILFYFVSFHTHNSVQTQIKIKPSPTFRLLNLLPSFHIITKRFRIHFIHAHNHGNMLHGIQAISAIFIVFVIVNNRFYSSDALFCLTANLNTNIDAVADCAMNENSRKGRNSRRFDAE